MPKKNQTEPKYYEVKTWKEFGRHPADYEKWPAEPNDCEHQWEEHDGPNDRKLRDCDRCGLIEELVTVAKTNRPVTAPTGKRRK